MKLMYVCYLVKDTMNEQKEIWKFVKDNPKYSISNTGRVRNYLGRELKVSTDKNGFATVTMSNKKYKLHVLLARTFLPNPENHTYVEHIDGDVSNNSLDNLRWTDGSVLRETNTSGKYRGVTRIAKTGKYMAVHRKVYLGTFDTAEEASEEYEKARKAHMLLRGKVE